VLRIPGSRWWGQFWDDVKASTDASILAVLRVFGLLYGRIDRQLPIDQAWRKAMSYRLSPHVGWRHAFGGITYLLFMVLVATGVLLAFYYRPSVEEAYPSIQYITSEVPFGWLIRDLHVWSANLIVLAMLAHMARVFFAGAYKPPRETSWLVGLLLLAVVLAFGTTGYLLPWDQWAYWTTTEILVAAGAVPIIGGWLQDVMTGDVFVSGATLSRFFAIHVIVLPWVAFGLLALHFVVVRKHGIAPTGKNVPTDAVGASFYPTHLLRLAIVGALVLAVVISLAAMYPRPVGDLATPYEIPDEIISTWIGIDVRLALLRYLGLGGPFAFVLLGFLLALLPLFDRRSEKRMSRRPLVAALGLIFFLGFLAAWLVGRQIHSLPVEAGIDAGILEERAVPTPPPEFGDTGGQR
jgi:quinol-cytochrome oxidoreductase complex cytochrome b subunit